MFIIVNPTTDLVTRLQVFRLQMGNLSNDNGDGNEDGKRKNNRAGLSRKKKLSTRIVLFVHFFAFVARLRCETFRISRFIKDGNTETTTTFFFFCEVR